jgi:hypothetical protein
MLMRMMLLMMIIVIIVIKNYLLHQCIAKVFTEYDYDDCDIKTS